MAIEGWDYKNIDDLAVLDQESLGEGTKRDFSFYYIDISSVSEGKLRLPSTKTIFRDAPSRARKIVRRGDVLMSMVRPNLKAFAYFDHPDDDCIASTGFAVLTARDQVDAHFILYSILSDCVTAQIEALVVGSNYPAINLNAVRGLRVLVPPYSEQNKIAEILSTVDQAIEQTEALIAKQQRIKTGLMQDLLTRGIDEHGNLRSEQTHEFKDSPLGRIPVEWNLETLNNCVRTDAPICYGILMPGQEHDGGVPVIKVKNIIGGHIVQDDILLTDPRIDAQYKRSRLRAGDLLLTIRGTTGRLALVPPELDGANITQDTARVRLKEEISSQFFYFLLQSFPLQDQIRLHTLGQAVKGINIGEVKKIFFGLPDRNEQEEIAKRLVAIQERIDSSKRELAKHASIKTALMQDLLTGEVRATPLLNNKEDV